MACYALGPADGESWLAPNEVVARLRAAFARVDFDAQEGIAHASRVLTRMKEIRAPQPVIDHLEQGYKESIAVAVSDEDADSKHGIGFVVMPEESIKIYAEPQWLPMIYRCMTALGYDMIEL